MMAGVGDTGLAHAAEFALVARRNDSLTSSGRFLVFVLVFVVSVGIAVAFAILGAWLILPFAGLEMVLLYLAFRDVERHAADYERIAIAGDRVKVELFELGRVQNHEFNRLWAQVVVSPDGSRLALRSHGRELEIGRHRNDEERLAAARELKQELRVGR